MSIGTRVQILDVDGMEQFGLPLRTPDASRPHINKEGTIVDYVEGSPRIQLDDGSELFGYECWWRPIEPA